MKRAVLAAAITLLAGCTTNSLRQGLGAARTEHGAMHLGMDYREEGAIAQGYRACDHNPAASRDPTSDCYQPTRERRPGMSPWKP